MLGQLQREARLYLSTSSLHLPSISSLSPLYLPYISTGLRSSNEKLAKCVQTLHAKGLGRLARAITNKSGSLGRGVKGLSIYGRFKGEHEEPDSD